MQLLELIRTVAGVKNWVLQTTSGKMFSGLPQELSLSCSEI